MSNSSSSVSDVFAANALFVADERIKQLKLEDLEKFQTLVTMHLSFLMDLNDTGLEEILEESDLPTTAEKPKLLFSIRKKSTKENSPSGKIFGARLSLDIINRVLPIMAYLSQIENLQREGVFRVSGNCERQRDLRERLDRGETMEDFESKFMVNDYATVFKSFLSELPEPLLTERHFNAYLQIAGMKDENKQIQCLQLLVQLLPSENFILLHHLIGLLFKITQEPQSKMTAENLAILFTPHIIVPRKTCATQLQQLTEVLQVIVATMIRMNITLFSLPLPFVQDAAHYCDEVEAACLGLESRHHTPLVSSLGKTEDQEQPGDDEIIISTTYSFTDRRASQEAARQSNTESALSDLYAHICQMPESVRKRKLVKEFGKIHGTPTSCCSPDTRKSTSSITASLQRFMSKRRRLVMSSQIIREDLQSGGMTTPQYTSIMPLRLGQCDTPGDAPVPRTPVQRLFQNIKEEEKMYDTSLNVFGFQEGIQPINLSPNLHDAAIGMSLQQMPVSEISNTQSVSNNYDAYTISDPLRDGTSAFEGSKSSSKNDDINTIKPMDCCDIDDNKENNVNEHLKLLMTQQNSPSYIRFKGYISPLACMRVTPTQISSQKKSQFSEKVATVLFEQSLNDY